MLTGVFSFKESEKLKENSIYCPVDFSRARASSCSPVFSIFRSLKNLKKTPSTVPWIFLEPGPVPARRCFQLESEKLKENSI
jgi:hypothetical protein